MHLITKLADNLVSKYRGVSNGDWQWYEDYLTYANAVIPEAMLLAGECTNNQLFKDIAHKTFNFLLKTTLDGKEIKEILNKYFYNL